MYAAMVHTNRFSLIEFVNNSVKKKREKTACYCYKYASERQKWQTVRHLRGAMAAGIFGDTADNPENNGIGQLRKYELHKGPLEALLTKTDPVSKDLFRSFFLKAGIFRYIP